MTHRQWKRHLGALGGAFFLLWWLMVLPTAAAPRRQGTDPRVEALLAEMSSAGKVAQMFMVSLWGEQLSEESADFLAAYNPGGVILFGYNTSSPAQITALTNATQQTGLMMPGGIPAWIAIDQEGGLVSRLADGFTTFPVNMAVAATGDPDYAHEVGMAMAAELRAVGINMNLAPVADVQTNPLNPVIDRRAYGTDPVIVGEMAAAMIEGLQAGGVMATAKHFPGHGDTGTDSHLELPVVSLDRPRLEAVELVPFRQAISADVGAIMAAHIWYTALEPTPDTPASLSAPVLSGLLRQEMAFDGLIMTDALDMDAIDRQYSLAEAAIRAIEAGADLITPGPHASLAAQQAAMDTVIAAVESGRIPIARIDESVRRILEAKVRFGVLDWQPLDPASAAARIDLATHQALVAEILAAAVTLVTDEQGLVPVAPEHQVVLIYPATRPSLARTCESYAPDVHLIGVSQGPTDEEQSWAVTAATLADVAIVFTQDLSSNPDYLAMVHALPLEKTIVVALRSPYDWQSVPRAAAYLATYSPLPEAVTAVCGALFGAQPITGRLPVDLADSLPAGTGLQRP